MSKCKILLRANFNISARFLQSLFVPTLEIANQSGFDQGDARDFAYKFSKSMVDHLKFGDYVQLGDMGGFSVSCNKNRILFCPYHCWQ